MPPTTGHLQLVQFASKLPVDEVVVVLSTQAHEPFASERVTALRQAVRNCGLTNVWVQQYHKTLPQDPATPGFWDLWRELMLGFGVDQADYIVASEAYGQQVAEVCGAQFMPYDIGRHLNPAKATPVRDDPLAHIRDIVPEFRRYIRPRITIFGAESTGKTTLSRLLAQKLDATWLFEYARPYLEQTVNEITVRSMTAIWNGQSALQRQADDISAKPYIIQDTDLFSTVGYWQFPHWQADLGVCPERLVDEARQLQSDLYIITKSNIPFESDPLRYGGDQREGSDDYWIELCQRYELPYVVLTSQSLEARAKEATRYINRIAKQKAAGLAYDRHGF